MLAPERGPRSAAQPVPGRAAHGTTTREPAGDALVSHHLNRLGSPVGSGLGLSIVKLALAKIGAELAVSNREGRSGVRSAVVFG